MDPPNQKSTIKSTWARDNFRKIAMNGWLEHEPPRPEVEPIDDLVDGANLIDAVDQPLQIVELMDGLSDVDMLGDADSASKNTKVASLPQLPPQLPSLERTPPDVSFPALPLPEIKGSAKANPRKRKGADAQMAESYHNDLDKRAKIEDTCTAGATTHREAVEQNEGLDEVANVPTEQTSDVPMVSGRPKRKYTRRVKGQQPTRVSSRGANRAPIVEGLTSDKSGEAIEALAKEKTDTGPTFKKPGPKASAKGKGKAPEPTITADGGSVDNTVSSEQVHLVSAATKHILSSKQPAEDPKNVATKALAKPEAKQRSRASARVANRDPKTKKTSLLPDGEHYKDHRARTRSEMMRDVGHMPSFNPLQSEFEQSPQFYHDCGEEADRRWAAQAPRGPPSNIAAPTAEELPHVTPIIRVDQDILEKVLRDLSLEESMADDDDEDGAPLIAPF
ncbi:hypothetical protein P280DRAFT_536335 [Massarina eburnea CBS 473.64]|uniref:Uncharacterized protein n=1 Tax=Massarina eburnea CBS 473.64 TaxID=1395130 RepID=A0A6A6RJT7_9PLEO|nr:hypothetical protein P280DRAFT_536335 [Massarina eburnea CBS 473.64]